MSALRFVVGDRTGLVIAELAADFAAVSWRLSDIGQANFAIGTTDPKATADILHFGNRVLIQFDNGLPDWGGVIDPPRSWGAGSIVCTAYSAEYVFGTRTSGKNRTFSGATVGQIFRELIEDAEAVYPLGVELGVIQYSGDNYTVDYHYDELLKVFRGYLTDKLSDADFDVTGSLSGGRIVFTANLYERRGADKLNYALIEGRNCTVTKYDEQGPIVNAWDVPGAGNDWDTGRRIGHAEDIPSISAHGYRQGSQVANDISDAGQLAALAATALAESKDPHNMFSVIAHDLPPAGFGDYGLGDRLRLIAHSVGFDGIDTTIRIVGRSYNPGAGTCELVVREE